jgi:hypothetical protein
MDGAEHDVVPVERVERAILVIRGHKVLLDTDLATLFGVSPKRLNEQVKRNLERFPMDFMFQLTVDEQASLRSQIATLKTGRGQHRKHPPYAFTEHGAIMAASVLSSPKAIEMSILVVRAFVKLRTMLAAHRQLAAKLRELEAKLSTHDQQIVGLFNAIRQLMVPPAKPKTRIGFGANDASSPNTTGASLCDRRDPVGCRRAPARSAPTIRNPPCIELPCPAVSRSLAHGGNGAVAVDQRRLPIAICRPNHPKRLDRYDERCAKAIGTQNGNALFTLRRCRPSAEEEPPSRRPGSPTRPRRCPCCHRPRRLHRIDPLSRRERRCRR